MRDLGVSIDCPLVLPLMNAGCRWWWRMPFNCSTKVLSERRGDFLTVDLVFFPVLIDIFFQLYLIVHYYVVNFYEYTLL